MKYRRFGRTGLMVSEVGFGSHHFDRYGRRIGVLTEDSFTEEERTEHVAKALDLGINYLHCAFTIGERRNAEIVLFGKALKELGRRGECYLAAQFMARPDIPKGDLMTLVTNQIEEHLRDLHTEVIDILEINLNDLSESRDDFLVEGIVGCLESLKEDGKTRFIGGVSHDREYLIELLQRYNFFDTIGSPYNLLRPEAGEKLFPLAKEKDAGVVAIQPFGKGSVFQLDPSDKRLQDIRKGSEESTASAALRWVLSDENVSVAIPGMKTIEEIIENVGVSGC